ncbi:mevalonate kinase [Striga asiatica]|uniref:Mevalonate kinase n=1 Tax=Striga asiatica TaxID=4170 RepID=A0A5A7RDB6_STRAF|nr:mevalonate kinase [Striga asiatica]
MGFLNKLAWGTFSQSSLRISEAEPRPSPRVKLIKFSPCRPISLMQRENIQSPIPSPGERVNSGYQTGRIVIAHHVNPLLVVAVNRPAAPDPLGCAPDHAQVVPALAPGPLRLAPASVPRVVVQLRLGEPVADGVRRAELVVAHPVYVLAVAVGGVPAVVAVAAALLRPAPRRRGEDRVPRERRHAGAEAEVVVRCEILLLLEVVRRDERCGRVGGGGGAAALELVPRGVVVDRGGGGGGKGGGEEEEAPNSRARHFFMEAKKE